MSIRSFQQLHRICERAAKKTHYPTVIAEIQRELPKEWWDAGESTVSFFLPAAILDLPTKLDRREALDSIPKDTPTPNLRKFVEDGIMALWEARQ